MKIHTMLFIKNPKIGRIIEHGISITVYDTVNEFLKMEKYTANKIISAGNVLLKMVKLSQLMSIRGYIFDINK